MNGVYDKSWVSFFEGTIVRLLERRNKWKQCRGSLIGFSPKRKPEQNGGFLFACLSTPKRGPF